MRKILLIVGIAVTAILGTAQAQEKCLSEIMFQEAAAKNSALLHSRQDLEDWTKEYLKANEHNHLGESAAQVNKIIPVVVHVIHYGGGENISKAQILNQIETLNLDFNYLNADTTNTPAVFRPLAGVTNVEFKMAQLDPNGNCTDGILRIYSALTYNARNNVKALSYWPSNQYLNIWVVSSIENSSGSPGQVIGFAQFPGTGPASTDGIVVKHDFMGSIGTAANSGNLGRTATHEIGHWLNLRHIWGDATCGNDQVSDTPTQFEANLSTCFVWPHISNCAGNAPNGDMYTNYMDYTNGDCQNMFSIGQSARMNATLNSAISGRINMWQPANLLATGTDGSPAVLCAPKSDFTPRPRMICAGGSLPFADASWGGQSSSRLWTFSGGTPATDTSANPFITYNTPGVYDVSLTITNAAGTDTKTETAMVIVSATVATGAVPFSEGFEGSVFPTANDWFMSNSNGGSEWEVSNLAASSGQYSINLYNYTGAVNGTDEFITNAFDLSNVTATQMNFKLAFALINSTNTNADKLVVYYSTNCGQTWAPRYSKTGTQLQTTATTVAPDFLPSPSDWRNELVSLTPITISTKPNVRFRFEFTYDSGNNIFIDDINITGTVGLNEVNAENANVTIYPNPSKSTTYVDFNMTSGGAVKIEVMDIQGRVVSTFQDELPSGDHQYTMNQDLATGVYMLRISFGDRAVTKKVVLN